MERRRIQLLDDKAATSVRGSQILGSFPRVIEELVLNSIQGYSNSIVISLRGLDEIIVIDDGVGIDGLTMKDYIGTAYCSSLNDGKGETLRSLASLCVEMKVETACWCLGEFGSSRLTASEKVFRDGAVINCNRLDDNDTTSEIIPKYTSNSATINSSGTTVTLRGLFHRHAVRRKQYTLQNTLVLTQIASCLRLIALAYPCISFELRSSMGNNIDFSFTSSTRTVTESRALVERLVDMYPDDFSQDNSIEVSLDEENVHQSKLNNLSQCTFRAFGAFCITKTDDDESAVVRNKELEIICINGRLAAHRDRLAELIIGQLRQGSKSNCKVRFFIHVIASDSELVVKDSVATNKVRQFDQLASFVSKMAAKLAMVRNQRTVEPVKTIFSQDREVIIQNNAYNRVVRGQQIVSNANAAALKRTRSPSSPFSDAFIDNGQLLNLSSTRGSMPSNAHTELRPNIMADLSLHSIDEAFFDSKGEQESLEDAEDTSSRWTKLRIKGLKKHIADLVPQLKSRTSDGNITLTKQMLQTADVIGQVELKFIVIKTACGKICILDQHAADERVALEKLENALFNSNIHDDAIIHMTKKSIEKKNILKSAKVLPPELVKLTQNDMATLNQHCNLLKKWKFDFDEENDGNTITLTGVPKVCDRVASVQDFMEFVKELGHLSIGKDVRPKFVKNILASNACRYAIMFGEELDEEQQRRLISNLANCDLSFICAHGRPSIIPLCDLNTSKVGSSIPYGNDDQGESMSERFGSRRLIRR